MLVNGQGEPGRCECMAAYVEQIYRENQYEIRLVSYAVMTCLFAQATSYYGNKFRMIGLKNPVQIFCDWLNLCPFGICLFMTSYFAKHFFAHVSRSSIGVDSSFITGVRKYVTSWVLWAVERIIPSLLEQASTQSDKSGETGNTE